MEGEVVDAPGLGAFAVVAWELVDGVVVAYAVVVGELDVAVHANTPQQSIYSLTFHF